MKKLFKIVAWLLGISVVLIVAAVVIVPLVVDPNDYKEDIAAAVRKNTGREFNIDGNIGLKVFPHVALDLGAVQLGNTPGFGEDFFARTEKVEIRVKLMPLLDREVQMETVRVDGLKVNLARDSKGRTNWDDLMASPEGESVSDTSAKPVAALALGGVNLQNASLTWNDAVTGTSVGLNEVNLETGPVSLHKPLSVTLSFNVESTEPDLNGSVALAGEMAYDPATEIATASGVELDVTMESPQIPGGKTAFNFSGDATFDQKNQSFSLAGLNLTVPKMSLGQTEAKVALKGDLSGELETGHFNSSDLSVSGTLAGADIPGNELPFELRSSIDLSMVQQTLVLDGLEFSAAELNGSGNLTVDRFLEAPALTGELSVNSFNPRKLMEKMGQTPPATSDPNALTVMELSAKLASSETGITLDPLTVRLDDTLLKGNIRLPDLSRLALVMDLAVDSLDADRYLPPSAAKTPASPGAAAPAATGIPLETLRALDVDARLAMGKLKVTGLSLDDIRVTLAAKDGLIRLSPLEAKLYGGTYTSGISVDARGEQAQISVDERLTGVRMGELLSALEIDTGEMDLSDAAGDLAVKADVRGDPEKQTYALNNATVTANVASKALPGGKLVAGAKGNWNLNLASGTFNGNGVNASVENLKLPSGLGATGTMTASALSGTLDAQSISATELTLDLKKLQLDPKAKAIPFRFAARQLDADLGKQTVNANDFIISSTGLKASGNASVSDLNGVPQAEGDLVVTELNPRKVLKDLGQPPINTADPTALSSFTLETKFKASQDSLSLNSLRMQLDETKIRGDVEIADLKSMNGIRFDLKSSRLNADRYLPPQAQGQAGTPGAAAAALPLELLRGLDAAGTLVISKLIISNLTLTDINLELQGKGGVVKVNPVNALLYGGSYAGNIKVDARNKDAVLTVDETLERVHIEPLLKDLNGAAAMSGRGGVHVNATATGRNTRQLKKTLSGDATFSLNDGAFKGIDIVNTVCNGLVGLLGGSQGRGGETRFSALTGTAKITDGVVDNRDFLAQSPLLRVNGGGTYDIPRDRIDYDVKASLVASCEGQGGLAVQELKNLPPAGVHISGPASNPKYDVDLASMLTALGGEGGLGKTLGVKELEGGAGSDLGKALGVKELEGLALPGLTGSQLGNETQAAPEATTETTKKKKKKKKKKKAAEPEQTEQTQPPSQEEAVQDLLKGLLN